MSNPLPTQARVLIVGGGIAGCSTAYHLAQRGWTDVLLLEQGKLTSGTTWHAAGLVGQMRPNRAMTAMSRYGIELYATLEAETGLATGWKACGSVNVARTPERLKVLRRQLALARSFGVECFEISPAEAGQKVPVMRTDDLAGAIWLPGDGKANPADLCMSLAKGARNRGVRMAEGVRVARVLQQQGRVIGVVTADGQTVHCEVLINCAGQWARQFGALAGVNVPLYSAEHFYIVTGPIPGVHPMLPVFRDPDGCIYYKEEVGGLVMGGFEMQAKPWALDPVPDDFEFQLLGEDWEQFEPLMVAALHRTPALETAEVKMLLNGPESFTPDGNFILGEAPELDGYFVCAGFNSAGIANAGGAGRLMAEWVVQGEPGTDVWDVDIRRFAPHSGNRRALRERTAETLGLHYAMRWPRQELATARPQRTSPLYDWLSARGAEWGSKAGWERANVFRPPGVHSLPPHHLDTPGWLPWVVAEMRATRTGVVLFDQSSFAKLLLQGPDALAVLQRLCARDVDVPVGRMVYTALLNDRGGFESDLTVIRLEPQGRDDRFLIITGSGQAVRDAHWIRRHTAPEARVVLSDVTNAWAVLSVMGPESAALLAAVSPDDLGSLRFAHTRDIDVGWARVRAARMAYVGGPGLELYVPVEVARHVALALEGAAQQLGLNGGRGLVQAGYWALDALRIEMGRRAWGPELGPFETPWQAGLGFAVDVDKPTPFIGQAALQASRGQPLAKKLVQLVFDDPAAYAWGGEPLLDPASGLAVGDISSAGWSLKAGACAGLAWVRGDWAQQPHTGTPAQASLWGQLAGVQLFDRGLGEVRP